MCFDPLALTPGLWNPEIAESSWSLDHLDPAIETLLIDFPRESLFTDLRNIEKARVYFIPGLKVRVFVNPPRSQRNKRGLDSADRFTSSTLSL